MYLTKKKKKTVWSDMQTRKKDCLLIIPGQSMDLRASLAIIETNWALAASLDKALAVAQQITKGKHGEESEPLPEGAAQGTSLAEGTPATSSARKQTRCQRRAKRKRLLAEANGGVHKTALKSGAQKQRSSMVDGTSQTFTNVAHKDLEAAEGGWLGSRKRGAPEEECTLQQLLQCGLKLVQWDGMSVP